MAKVLVEINGQMIDWALKQTDVPIEKLQQLFPKMFEWQKQTIQPTFVQLSEFSKKTAIPIGYFFLEKPPQENIPLLEYRTVESSEMGKASRDLVDTIYAMNRRQDWMREHLIKNGYRGNPFVASLKEKKNSLEIANKIRKDLNLQIGFMTKVGNATDVFKIIRNALEKNFILVMKNGIVGTNTHRTLDIKEFRAFVLIDEIAPLIFINGTDTANGQLFSLAHEIAHLWLGEESLFNLSDSYEAGNIREIERICNAVAAELLVPQALFEKQRVDTVEAIEEGAKFFRVSPIVIARRALDSQLITRKTYENIADQVMMQFDKRKKNPSNGGDFYVTTNSKISPPFTKSIINSVQTGETSYTEAYRLLNLTKKTYDNFVEKVGYNV